MSHCNAQSSGNKVNKKNVLYGSDKNSFKKNIGHPFFNLFFVIKFTQFLFFAFYRWIFDPSKKQ